VAFQETPLIGLPADSGQSKIIQPRSPLIITPRVKWERDPGISEMITYFDEEPRFENCEDDEQRFELLTRKELDEIIRITDQCRADFTYAARNFFWITTKGRGDKLFKLWESQELIYEHMLRMKARGIAQRIMILKARQLGARQTDVNTTRGNGESVKLGDVQVGDWLASVDEGMFGQRRKITPGRVIKKWEVSKPAFKITLESGREMVASEDHPFLVAGMWLRVADLCAGFPLSSLNDSWGFGQYADEKIIKDKVKRIDSLGVIPMVDIETTTGTFITDDGIINHNCSTLIEGLIAWRTMFFRNVRAYVVSYDAPHAAVLFGIMQHIYDKMPWWLKPMCASRKFEEGLIFDNPRAGERRKNPGLKSSVTAEGATKKTGVGQGVSISAFHGSEYTDWGTDENAREIIEGDVGPALAEGPETFGFLESTGKGIGNYAHKFWNQNVQMGRDAEWEPLFLPFFFEFGRRVSVPPRWRPREPEEQMRNRILTEWVRCNNSECGQFHERTEKETRDRAGDVCPTCEEGKLKPFELAPEQMYWMQRKRALASRDEESKKKLLMEFASTAEESWQASGTQVFSETERAWVNSTVRPPERIGFLDNEGRFHGSNPSSSKPNPNNGRRYDPCYQTDCTQDHEYGDHHNERPLQVWEDAVDGAEYMIGADVAEGLGGNFDYSVAAVLKVGRKPPFHDHIVAVWRSNTTDTIEFAKVLNALGRRYNECCISVEVNRYDTTLMWLRTQLQYPNLYRWKHVDSLNPTSNKIGWLTTMSSKPRLWQIARTYMQQKTLHCYSKNFAMELLTFTKEDYEGRGANAEGGCTDDEIMASLIAVYCAHDNDWDENLSNVRILKALTMEEATWRITCQRCELTWPANEPPNGKVSSEGQLDDSSQCSRCGCRVLTAERNKQAEGKQENPFMNADESPSMYSMNEPQFDQL
jgi:hypothetical protein